MGAVAIAEGGGEVRRIALLLLVLLTFGCATVPPPVPSYDMTTDAEGNVLWKRRPVKVGPSYFWTYAALTITTILDVETTFHALDRCSTCYEANPLMAPFVKRGRGATYAFAFSLNVIQMERARRARKAGERHWYLGPALASGVHGILAASNSQISN